MTGSPRDTDDNLATDETATKRPWHTPSLEEVDYGDTEAGATPAVNYDGQNYVT